MHTNAISALEFVEQRTALLRALSEALAAASASVVGFDLEGLERRISEQQKFCSEIALLDQQVDLVRLCAGLAGSEDENLSNAFGLLREAQARVKQLNDRHQVLLRRSHRTVNALMRSYQTFAADVYENPAHRRVSTGEGA